MKLKNKRVVYKGFHTLEVRTYEDTDRGIEIERDVLTAKDACSAFAYHKDRKKFAFVKQFRGGAGRVTTECVAGMIDEGETPLDAIRREVREEIGCKVIKHKMVNFVDQGPASIDGTIFLFLCVVEGEGLQQLDEDEFVEVEWIDEDIIDFIKLHDMKSIALMYEFNKRREFFKLD